MKKTANFLFLLLLSCGVFAAELNGFSNTQEYLERLVLNSNKAINDYYIGKGKSREGRKLAWRWSIYADAAIEAYLKTNDRNFLHITLNGCLFSLSVSDKNLLIKDEVRNNFGPSWSSLVRTDKFDKKKRQYTQEITVSGLVLIPCLKAVNAIHKDPSLQEEYGTLTQYILRAAMEIFNYHLPDCPRLVHKQLSYRYCITPTKKQIEPVNHIAAFGAMLSLLYEVSRDEKVKTVSTELARFMKSCMQTENNGSYSWAYRPLVSECVPDLEAEPTTYSKRGKWEYTPEPFWKARTTILFPIYAFEAGVYFDESDIEKIVNTFKRNILKNDSICMTIASDGCRKVDKSAYLQSTIAKWAILSKYDPEIMPLISSLFDTHPNVFPKRWKTSPWTIYAWSKLLEK